MSPKQNPATQSISALIRRAVAWCKHRAAPVAINEHVAFLSCAVDHCDLESRMRELERRQAHAGFSRPFARF